MASQTSRTLGLIVAALGVLNIFSSWYVSYTDNLDHYWLYYNSYDGFSIISSGVFTDPDALLYHMVSDSTGIFVPTLCSALFCLMFLRFFVKTDRPYLLDMVLVTLLVVFACAYMMVWGHWGEIDTIYGLEHHGYGAGAIYAIALACAATLFSYFQDIKNKEATQAAVTVPPVGQAEEPRQKLESVYFDMFCPKCGNGIKSIDGELPKFCQHCGNDLTRFTEK